LILVRRGEGVAWWSSALMDAQKLLLLLFVELCYLNLPSLCLRLVRTWLSFDGGREFGNP
jgi:hypothetical protein